MACPLGRRPSPLASLPQAPVHRRSLARRQVPGRVPRPQASRRPLVRQPDRHLYCKGRVRGSEQAQQTLIQEPDSRRAREGAAPALFYGLEELQCTIAMLLGRHVVQDDPLQLLHLLHVHPVPPPGPAPPEARAAARAEPRRRGNKCAPCQGGTHRTGGQRLTTGSYLGQQRRNEPQRVLLPRRSTRKPPPRAGCNS